MASFKHNCYECGKEYIAKRSTSKFCGAKCRQRHNRKNKNGVNIEVEIETAIDSLQLLQKANTTDLFDNSARFEDLKRLVLEVDLLIGLEEEKFIGNLQH